MRAPPVPLVASLLLLAAPPARAGEPEAPPPLAHLEGEELTETPGTFGDPFRVVLTQPGMGGIASGVGYPVFRGREPGTTSFFLDGVRVPLPYHLLVGPSVVNPDFIQALDVRESLPAERGAGLGAAVDASVRGPGERLRATASVDLLATGLSLQAPIPSTGTGISFAARLGTTPLLVSALVPGVVAHFNDYQGLVEQRLGPGTLRLLAFGASDLAGLRSQTQSAVPFLLSHRVDLRWRQPLGAGELEAGATYGWDRIGAESVGGTASRVDLRMTERTAAARLGFRASLSGTLGLSVGADVERRGSDYLQARQLFPGAVDDPDRPTVVSLFETPVANATFAGVYAKAAWSPAPGWTLFPSLRLQTFHLVPKRDWQTLEPQLQARTELGPVTLWLSVGMHHQPPTQLISLPAAEASALRYGLQEAVRLSARAVWVPAAPWEVTASAYYDPFRRMLELSLVDTDFLRTDVNELLALRTARGHAAGAELRVRRHLGHGAYGWLSYSFQRSVRGVVFTRHDEHGVPLGEGGAEVPYALNQQHVLNAVATVPLGAGWTVGAGVHLNTGIPEAGGLTSVTSRVGTDPAGNPAWIEQDPPNVDRLPAFFRVDARVSKTWRFQDFSLQAYLDVFNAALARETLRFNYERRVVGGETRLTRRPDSYLPVPLTVPLLGVKVVY